MQNQPATATSALFGGDGEDLLIGGTTAHDTAPSTLEAVMAEWTRTDADYATRLGNLRRGLLTSAMLQANEQQNRPSGESAADVLFGVTDRDLNDQIEGEVFARH